MSALNAKVKLEVSVLGEMQLKRTIQGRIKAVSNWSPAFRLIAADFVKMEAQQFDAEGAFGGNPRWKPLSAKYAAWKARHFPGKPILQLKKKLKHVMTHPKTDIAPLRLVLSFLGYRRGSWDIPALHQTGTTKMPARKPINLTRSQRARWMKFFRRLLMGDNP